MAALAQRGGVMAPEDLAAHRSHPTRPIHSTFRGHTVYEIPPPVAVRAVPRPPRSDSAVSMKPTCSCALLKSNLPAARSHVAAQNSQETSHQRARGAAHGQINWRACAPALHARGARRRDRARAGRAWRRSWRSTAWSRTAQSRARPGAARSTCTRWWRACAWAL